MKQVILMLLVSVMLAGCSTLGLTTPSNYMTPQGVVMETTEEMAIIMATRDGDIAKKTAFAEAIPKADSEGGRLALVVGLLTDKGVKYERSKTWDERLLPWMSGVFMPIYIAERAGSKSGKNGISVEGDGNTIVYSEDDLTDSTKTVTTTSKPTITTQTQIGTGESESNQQNNPPPDEEEEVVEEPAAEEPVVEE